MRGSGLIYQTISSSYLWPFPENHRIHLLVLPGCRRTSTKSERTENISLLCKQNQVRNVSQNNRLERTCWGSHSPSLGIFHNSLTSDDTMKIFIHRVNGQGHKKKIIEVETCTHRICSWSQPKGGYRYFFRLTHKFTTISLEIDARGQPKQ